MTSLRRDNAIASVFPITNFTTPTPEATPIIGILASPGRPFGGFIESSAVVTHEFQASRAWSIATRYLHVSDQDEIGQTIPKPKADVKQAFSYLCSSSKTLKELVTWYSNDIATDFRSNVLSEIDCWNRPINSADADKITVRTIDVLQKAQDYYLRRPRSVYWDASSGEEQSRLREFISSVESQFRNLVSQNLDQKILQHTLRTVFYRLMRQSLIDSANIESCRKDGACHCRVSLGEFRLAELCDVGLGARNGEKAFASAVHDFLTGPAVNRYCFRVDWTGHRQVTTLLQQWIEVEFVPFVESVMSVLVEKPSYKLPAADESDIVSSAINNLGRQRTSDIFDYVRRWPASEGAIRDLREYIALDGPKHKAFVCASFSEQAAERILHSGISTTKILSIYIKLIHAFRALDSRGVLLEKVAGPVRAYLRLREDTVNIIAASLLVSSSISQVEEGADMSKVCLDIPAEIEKTAIEGPREEHALDWNDMEWIPDPIDAGPDYKSSKSEDVIAYILGLFDQDEFINELRAVLATSLVASEDKEYVKETRLVELLKTRLDVTKLQAIEVMLKDVRDSVVINNKINPASFPRRDGPPTPQEVWAMIPEQGISPQALYRKFNRRIKQTHFVAILETVATRRQKLVFPKRTRSRPSLNTAMANLEGFSVNVISKNFWPDLSTEEYKLPVVLAEAETEFRTRFEEMGGRRKLHFRPALGRVTVKLQLEDRTHKEDHVQTWKASVIDAFSKSDPDQPVSFTPDELVARLSMDGELVRSALSFWVTKKVLYALSDGSFAVLERLDMDTGQPDADILPNNDGAPAVKSQDAMLQASAPMFCTFISHMLRNSGAKQVDGFMGITNMLKMVCPTFTYGEDEVRWLLGAMESRGEVTHNGDLWSIT